MADTPLDDESLSADAEIAIEAVAGREAPDGTFELLIKTSRGEISGLLHPCEGEPGAALFLGGALGGLDGPAGGLYPRLARELAARESGGLSSLRLHYRMPGEFLECVLDALAGLSFLKGIGARRVAVVGHSFGAAVAIKAGELSELACGVAALSSQLYGTRTVDRLGKPLLLAHGTLDSVLDCQASRDIYERALEPKQLVLYDGAGHALTQCADELFALLRDWLIDVAGGGAA